MRYRYRIFLAEWPIVGIACLWAYLIVAIDDPVNRMVFIAGPQLGIFIAWRTWKRLNEIRQQTDREQRIAFVRENKHLFVKPPG